MAHQRPTLGQVAILLSLLVTLGCAPTPLASVPTSAPISAPTANLPTLSASSTPALITIQSASVNVRSGPGTAYAIIGTLAKGDSVPVKGIDADRTWYAIDFESRTGWVSVAVAGYEGSLSALAVLSSPAQPATNAPDAPTTISKLTPTSGPAAVAVACPNIAYTCKQLTTCAQAKACLAAGNKSLDKDGDGIPCEALCR